MAPASASFDVGQPLDLEASLLGGQAHRWKREGEWYSGVLRGNLVLIRQSGQTVEFHGSPAEHQALTSLVQSHLRLDDDLEVIQAGIAGDANVAAQVHHYPGLRVLRQEPWECLVAYICSANSNIETIHLNMERLSNEFGDPLTLPHPDPAPGGEGSIRRHTFPKPIDLAEAGEMELRRLKLGFRAPYVHQAAIAVAEKRLDLEHLVAAPYPEAKAELMALKGIGDKIADCIALMSLEKMEAFPDRRVGAPRAGRLVLPRPEDAHQPRPAGVGPGLFRTLRRLRQPVPVPRKAAARQEARIEIVPSPSGGGLGWG